MRTDLGVNDAVDTVPVVGAVDVARATAAQERVAVLPVPPTPTPFDDSAGLQPIDARTRKNSRNHFGR
jgi:hypothetical protein